MQSKLSSFWGILEQPKAMVVQSVCDGWSLPMHIMSQPQAQECVACICAISAIQEEYLQIINVQCDLLVDKKHDTCIATDQCTHTHTHTLSLSLIRVRARTHTFRSRSRNRSTATCLGLVNCFSSLFSPVRMAAIDWRNEPLTLVVIFFALCLLLLTWSIAGIACCACHSSGIFLHCDTHTHTQFFLLFILFLCTCICDSVCACRGGYFEMFKFLGGISEYSTVNIISVLLLFFTLCTGPGTHCHP